jgi:hypothetical protein
VTAARSTDPGQAERVAALVRALVDAATDSEAARVRELLRDIDEPTRRALRPGLKAAVAQVRAEGRMWSRLGTYDALGLAALGCTAGAASAAQHLHSYWRWGPTAGLPLVEVLLDRDPPWLPDLLARLTEAERTDFWGAHWRIAEQLRVALGSPRPHTRWYVRGLVEELVRGFRQATDPVPPPVLDQVLADDELVALVPLVLEHADLPALVADQVQVVDRAARRTEVLTRSVDDTWPGVVVALCDRGLLDRGTAIDACLRVLLRNAGDGPTAPHLAMLTTLAATDEEVAARRTYGQLAGDGAGPCAKHAQVALRKAWEAGVLAPETVLEVSRLVLARPEKGLVTTQLGWLDKLARKSAAPDAALLVVADAFAHERTDVQERALAAVAKHLAGADATTVAELVVAADALAPALRQRAAEVLGTTGDPADVGSAGTPSLAVPLVGPPPAREWPAGAADLGALAEDCAALVERPEDPGLLESVLAGVARFRNADRTAFDDALAPVRHRVRSRDVDSMSSMVAEFGLLAAPVTLLRMVLLEPPDEGRGRWRGMRDRSRHQHRYALPDPAASPNGVVVQRLREVAARVLAGEVATLVATPTDARGVIDPLALATRIADLEAAGGQPWPADLQQALLRLPREPDPDATARAAALSSPAGSALHARLRDGRAEVETRPVVARVVPRQRWMWPSHPQGEVALVAVDGPRADPRDLATLATDLHDPHGRAGRHTRHEVAFGMGLWCAALPADPEVVAAHALLALCDLPIASGLPAGRALLVELPAMPGPTGAAVALAVANALAAEAAADRTAGTDAVVDLGTRGAVGTAYGRALLLLARGGDLKLGRVASTLAEALRAGPAVAPFVWALAAEALPAFLGTDVRDAYRLMAVASDAAALSGARGQLDGLAAVAARGGSSRLVIEAKRLQRILSP